MVAPTTILSAATLGLAAIASVDAHGWIKTPAAEFTKGQATGEWVVILQPAWPWEGTGSWKGGDQVGQYAKLSKKNGFDTLRSFIENKGAVCGYTNPNASPKAIPSDGNVLFGHHDPGFTHQGPCEIWLDNKMVFHNDNCEKSSVGKGVIPVDFSSCKGNCMLRFFWLGFQNEQWQVYKNCIPLKGGSGTGSSMTPKPAATTAKPAATTTKPATTTAKPTTTTAKPAATTAKPATTTIKPVATTAKPAATTVKPAVTASSPTKAPACKRRLRN